MKNFLLDVNKKGNIEFCKINEKGCIVISEEEAFTNKEDNIYFLGGAVGGQRSKDIDIKHVSYLRFDIDIFNNIEEIFAFTPSQNDLDYLIDHLKEELVNTYFKDWSYIVKSGKGIHLYFCGDVVEIDHKTFSLGMNRLYRYFYTFFEKSNPQFKPDFACSNISRIMRLPGSINQKNGVECKIIYSQEKDFNIKLLFKFAEKEEQEKREVEERNKREIEERIKSYTKGGNELYEELNSIPAYEVAQWLIPDFPYDGKKNFKNNKRGFTGYYYCKDTNTICNGGSRYFNWGTDSSCYNNFSMVKNFKNYTDKETFNFFKELLGK